MDFLDKALIVIRSGDGGSGCMSFRREKNVPFGGPDGGDGGRGGEVWAESVEGLSTLSAFRRSRRFAAGNGKRGAARNRTGERGEDRIIRVPAGTMLIDAETETLIADLAEPGVRVRLGSGGAGGWGNTRFRSSTNRAPRRSTPGRPGVEYSVRLQLKLLADAGLVGLPNAGKSTFLRTVTRARPKVAPYPFTTLHPHLGVVGLEHDAFVLADIPGLIEDAHAGAGLGDRFLGHVERCAVLVHLVDCQSRDVAEDFRVVSRELRAYGAGLADKPRIVRLSKTDAIPEEQLGRLCSRVGDGGRRQRGRTLLRGWRWHRRYDRRDMATRLRGPGRTSMKPDPGQRLEKARTVVLKIGSALLVDPVRKRLREAWLTGLARDIAMLHGRGQQLLLVSSGAIALGRRVLRYDDDPLPLERSQAAAAVGQIQLAEAYAASLAPYGITAAQVLLTLGDTQNRRRYLNARATVGALLEARAVPVINENDTVATDEIRYGDNDRLAARVALMAGADLMVMLSDIDGLYTADPRVAPDASRIESIREITPEMLAAAGSTGSATARGGMHTKLLAAQSAMQGGCVTVITQGQNRTSSPETGERGWGKLVLADRNPDGRAKALDCGHEAAGGAEGRRRCRSRARKREITASGGTNGRRRHIRQGRSGRVAACRRRIHRRRISAYSAVEAKQIAGRSLRDIPGVLGYSGRGALVHRDDMVLWGGT